jgi:hypothetical protein
VIEHILTKLPMDLSMRLCFNEVNWGYHKVVGECMEWYALNIVKYRVFYYHIIATQGPLRWFLKQHLYFEIDCPTFCLLNEEDNWHFGWQYNHVQIQVWHLVWTWRSMCKFVAHFSQLGFDLERLIGFTFGLDNVFTSLCLQVYNSFGNLVLILKG